MIRKFLDRRLWAGVFLISLLLGAVFMAVGNEDQAVAQGKLAFISFVVLVISHLKEREQKLTLPRLPIGLLVFLGYTAVVLFISSAIFFRAGTLGLRDDWPIPALRLQNLELPVRETFYSWNENYLGRLQDRQSANYVDAATGLLALFGADGWLISRYPLLLLPFAGYFFWRLARYLNLNPLPAFLGGLFYLLSPYVYSIFISGYAKFFVSFALFPLFVEWFERFRTESSLRRFIQTSFLFGIVAGQLNFFLLGGLYVALRTLIGLLTDQGRLSLKFRLGLFSLLTMAGAVILQPAIFLSIVNLIFRSENFGQNLALARASWIEGLSSNLSHAWSQIGAAYTYFSDAYLKAKPADQPSTIRLLFDHGRFLLLLLVFLPFTRKTLSRFMVIAGWLLLIGTFYVKGATPPFGQAFAWLVLHFPPLLALRNTSYATFLSGLGLSLLVAFAAEQLLGSSNPQPTTHNSQRLLRPVVGIGAIVGVLLLTSWPFMSRSFGYKVTPYVVGSDSKANFEFLAEEEGKSRSLSLPMLQPLVYTDMKGVESAPGLNPFVLHPPRSSLYMGHDGGSIYETPKYHTFIANLLNQGESERLGQALSLADVSTVVLDKHFESKYADFIAAPGDPQVQAMSRLSSTIASLNAAQDLRKYHEEGAVVDYENTALVRPSLLRAAEPVLVSDGYELWRKISSAEEGSSQLPVFAASGLSQAWQQYQAVWLSEFGFSDLIFAPFHDRIVEPGEQLASTKDPDARSKWVAEYQNEWWWYDPAYNTLENSSMTVSRDKESFTVELSALPADRPAPSVATDGVNELWVKVYKGPAGSHLKFLAGDELVGETSTFDQEADGFRWERIAERESFDSLRSLRIESQPGENVIAAVLVVERAEREAAEKRAQALLEKRPVTQLIDGLSKRSESVFNLPKSGEYQLQLTGGEGIAGSISLDGRSIQFQLSKRGVNELPPINLTAGKHRVRVTAAIPAPFLMRPDLTRASGQGTDPSQDGAVLIGEDRSILQLRASNGEVHSMVSFPRFSQDRAYRVRFEFRALEGEIGTFAISDQAEVRRGYRPLFKTEEWQGKEFIWTPLPGQTSAFLDLVAHKPQLEHTTVNQYQNITIEELPRLDSLLLVEADPQSPTNNSQLIQVMKHNPTRYTAEIETKGPTLLTFLSANDPGWEATVGGKKLEKGPVVAGYAPSWIVPESGRVELRFRPERLFKISLAASWIFFFLGLGSFVFRRFPSVTFPAWPAGRRGKFRGGNTI